MNGVKEEREEREEGKEEQMKEDRERESKKEEDTNENEKRGGEEKKEDPVMKEVEILRAKNLALKVSYLFSSFSVLFFSQPTNN